MASRAEYNKKKQTESVQFGAGQNNIGRVQGGGEEFSSRGVVSMVGDEQKLVQAGIQYGAEGASRLIGEVKEFGEGMAIAETSQKYAEAVNAFLPDAERDAQVDRQNEELADIQSVGDYYEEEAFRTFGDGKTTGDQAVAAISLAADNTKAKLNKERLGHVQGKISEEQFLNRTARITKDAIARHPTLADRFVSDMNHIYEVARVKDHRDDLSDQRKTIAAQVKEANTKNLNLFTARNGYVPINYKTGLPDQALMSAVNKQYYDEITSVENTTKKITSTIALSDAEKEAEFNEMIEVSEDGEESELTKYTYGSTSILLDKWQKEIEGVSGKEKDIKIREMRAEMNEVIHTAQTTFVSRYGNNETLKSYMSIFISRTDKAITDMENSMDGTQAAKRLKNDNDIYRSKEIRNFSSMNNITAQGLADILNIIKLSTEAKLYSNMNYNRGDPALGIPPNQGKILSSNLLTMVNQIVNGSIDGINNADPKAPAAALDAINNTDEQVSNQKVPNEDPDKQQKINNVAVMNSISTIEKMKDRTDQYKATEETLDRFINNPNTPNLLAKLAPESKDRLEKHYRKFIKITDDSLKRDIENVRASGMDIKVEFNNGRLSFHSSSNAAEANNLTHRYTGRFEKFTKFMGLLENKNSTDANFLEQNIMRSIPNLRKLIEENVSAPSSPLSSIQTQKEYEYEKATKEYDEEVARQALNKEEAESEVKKKDSPEVDRFGGATDLAGEVEELKKANKPATAISPEDEERIRGDVFKNPDGWTDEKEKQFQKEVKATEWYKEMIEDYDNVDLSLKADYNYRTAWENGVHLTAERSPVDGKIHWQSSTPDGEHLKSEDHPTRWKEEFMRETGRNPDEEGLTEGQAQEILSKENTGESLWEEGLKRGKDLVGKAKKAAEYLLPSMNSLPIASPNNPNGMDKKENRFSFDTVESPELNELVERHFTRENKEGKGLNIKGSEKHTRNNWEIPKKILADLANKFSWTESRNQQSIRNSEGSTATGFYQFLVGTQAERDAKENTSLQAAITRVKRRLDNPPAWLDKLYVDGKVGELTRDQQTLLLLGDLLEKKGGDELWKIMLDPKSQDGTGEKYRKAQYDMYIKLHHTDKKGVPMAVKANAQKHILYVNKYYH